MHLQYSDKTKFRVWFNCFMGNPNQFILVNTLGQAMAALDMLAKVGENYAEMVNVSGVEYFNEESQEWEEFYDADGNDINAYWEAYADKEELPGEASLFFLYEIGNSESIVEQILGERECN